MSLLTAHDIAKQLLIDTEVFLCDDQYAGWPTLDVVKRYSIRWWKFLKMGIAMLIKPLLLYVCFSLVFTLAVMWMASAAPITDPKILSILLPTCQLLPIFIVAFALPSTYGDRNIPSNLPSIMSVYLRDELGLKSSKQIDAVKKSIKLFEDSTKNRITILKWLFSLCWAGFGYLATKFWDMSIGKTLLAKELNEMLFYIAFGIVFLIIGYLIIWGYEAAVERLFQSIEIGTNQAIIDVD